MNSDQFNRKRVDGSVSTVDGWISRVDSAEACASFGWNKECLRQCWLCKFGSRWVGGLKISRNIKLLHEMVIDCWSICWELEYGTSMQSLLGYPDVGNHQLGLSQQGKRLKAIWSRTERYAQRFRECRKLALRSEKHDPKFIRSMSSMVFGQLVTPRKLLGSSGGSSGFGLCVTALRNMLVDLDVVTMVYLENGDGTSWFWYILVFLLCLSRVLNLGLSYLSHIASHKWFILPRKERFGLTCQIGVQICRGSLLGLGSFLLNLILRQLCCRTSKMKDSPWRQEKC